MIVACFFCRSQGLPSVQRELEPYRDMGVVWTICVLHRQELTRWGRAAEAFTARLKAQAEAAALRPAEEEPS